MTVVFVADEGVADSGFNATYRAVSVLDREYLLMIPVISEVSILNTHIRLIG